jgi:hypothetical protein
VYIDNFGVYFKFGKETDMTDNQYDEWFNNSQQWREELEKQLGQHGGQDLVVIYSDMAFAFPSREPHPFSFDFPRIDEASLFSWAKSKGWKVRIAHDMTKEQDQRVTSVRFTKE